MRLMSDQHLAQLEARLERLVEGLFTNLFNKRVHAHDLALHLARALENGLEPAYDGDPRPVAPDEYMIAVHPDTQHAIHQRYPALSTVLCDQIIEWVNITGARLPQQPVVRIIADSTLSASQFIITAQHSRQKNSTTSVMQPIRIPQAHETPQNPQLIVEGTRIFALNDPLISIGRGRENHIVLDDGYVSRQHAQIRLRFGHYMIFDTNSQSGTYVNDVRVKEHRLQAGDVIRLGRSSLVYMEDDDPAFPDHPDMQDAD